MSTHLAASGRSLADPDRTWPKETAMEPRQPRADPNILRVADLAKRLKIGERQTREALRAGRLPGLKVNDKTWLIWWPAVVARLSEEGGEAAERDVEMRNPGRVGRPGWERRPKPTTSDERIARR